MRHERDTELGLEYPEENHSSLMKRSTFAAIAVFSIGFMVSEPNLDAFDIEEAIRYIMNERTESMPIHIAGFVTSFISNVPLLAAIIYCWMKGGHQHQDEHADQHEHSPIGGALECVAIGTPFALMGVAAYLDTVKEFKDPQEMTAFEKVYLYAGSAISGLITGTGAYKLHSFHVHAAAEENGGGVTGFIKGLYKTFVLNIWKAKDRHEETKNKVLAVLNEAWKKYGILAAHGFLGSFAANAFLEETNLQGSSFGLVLKTFLPLAVLLYEGNTEARSMEIYQDQDEQDERVSYSLFSKLVVTLSGVLHTIPSITACALMIGSFSTGPFEGKLYNSLIYAGVSLLLGYPSVQGFAATTIQGFDVAVSGLSRKWSACQCRSSRRDEYQPIEAPQEGFFSKLIFRNLFSCRDQENEQLDLLIHGYRNPA